MSDFADWTSGGGGGGGGYLSLIGAGQTATPGELDQSGPFTINVPFQPPGNPGFTVDDKTANSGNPNGVPSVDVRAERNPVRLIAGIPGAIVTPSVVVGGGDMRTIAILAQDLNTTVGHITIIATDLTMGTATGGGNSTIRCTVGPAPPSTPSIGFFGNTPVTRPGIGGSRGGNVALANLLTALQNLGLIFDSTSP